VTYLPLLSWMRVEGRGSFGSASYAASQSKAEEKGIDTFVVGLYAKEM